ncbi:peptidase inhibitor family I36 protein [Kitasatospora sp. NPDC057198]|uniref:peptidase inhibitor family I36 protein n=1 Tax=Kitasatospora sp. NPDC057198 TaxID=3346046 RepID=UPI00364514CF
MRSLRTLVAVAGAAGALVLAAPTAIAAPAPSAPSAPTGPGVRQSAGPAPAAPSKPVIATYHGKRIDLSEGWAGASVCTEVPGGAVYCHDSLAEADAALPEIAPALAEAAKAAPAVRADGLASPQAISDCTAGWACLYEHSDYSGRILRWSEAGTKNLDDWSFRDTASSACVNRSSGGMSVYDERSFLPDPWMSLGNGYCYDFTTVSYPTGGNWNDKADYVEL